MSGIGAGARVPFLPEVWLVPATLADLECRHGELGGCTACDRDDRQAELERELELEVKA